MSTREPASWRPLPLPVSCGLPVLLVSAYMGSSSYVVSISDMANIWSESMDRKTICMRGWSENTSIDPSDTAENMNKLLSCLKTALDPTQDGHDTTSFSLSPATAVDAGEGGLIIKVTCRLPGLEPLRWPMHLKKQPSSAIATDLVLPLVQAQSYKRRQVNSLMEVIKRKDAVITKISDKLQAMGAGLEHVFTALSGRKRVTRANAEDRVKGVGLFDESKWDDELDADAPRTGSLRELVQGVFGERGLELRTSLEINASPELDRWWHDFQPTAPISQQKQAKDQVSKDIPTSLPSQSTRSNDDDNFQIQSTPPDLKPTEETADKIGKAHATVEEDEDLEASDSGPPSALSNRTRQPETKSKSSRLGAIGAKKQLAQPRDPSPPSDGNTTRLPLDDEEETASEASEEDDVTASLPNSSPELPSLEHAAPKQSQMKGGLGMIGGGTPKTHPSNRETEAATTKDKTHPATLGIIGGKLSKTVHQQVDERLRRTTQHIEGSSWEGQPRETSQERADGRREELKRELEKKAAAGPARKKRRF